MEIRALSWKEPYAFLMLHGKVETRTWKTNYRGMVLICASKVPYTISQVNNISGDRQFKRIKEKINWLGEKVNSGYAFALGNLVDCRPMTPADEDKCFVKYNPDLYCHIYENVKPIIPFGWKGSQGWKKLTQEQIEKINF